eukprot:TRINITY_DN14116_c0_g7_i1.p1 TRINITY_DN14116_c0_g7~~TRINITY_DN14116_c0_g7_i1.p1  ORF type:complete len:997 (-),score=207.98 TRINITY_DN14116_c0_g7_i1:88-3078(-)
MTDESLKEQLYAAEKALSELSGVGSANSEERDPLSANAKLQEEIERRSSESSTSSRKRKGVLTAKMLQAGSDVVSDDGSQATFNTESGVNPQVKLSHMSGAMASSTSGSSRPAVTPINDTVEIAILEAKRAALKPRDDADSLLHSHSDSGTSGDHSSGAGKPLQSKTVVNVAKKVLPTRIIESLTEEKQIVVENVMEAVVEKTGRELAEMQKALDEEKAKALAEAKERAHLQAKVLKIKASEVVKENLEEDLTRVRNIADEVKDQRDDLEDKLVGMQALLDAKMERYRVDTEELRKEMMRSENQIKKIAEVEKAKLAEKLEIATKEVERAKKQSIATNAERDVLHRAEQIAQRKSEAEIQSLQAELLQATLALKENGITLEDKNVASASSDPTLQSFRRSLRIQKEQNKQLAADYEVLRLQMLESHKEKDDELASLKAKAEVQKTIPMLKPKRSKHRVQATKLASIGEEEDDDMRSQACSGVSGRVSSEGDGVGDLRDFDDYDQSAAMHDDDLVAKTDAAKLREKLADAESWYKHMAELKKAKETEHAVKIDRLYNQMQAFREEAKSRQREVERLQETKIEMEAEKEANIAVIETQVMEKNIVRKQAARHVAADLEDKIKDYAGQVVELRDKYSMITEEKRAVTLRLADTQQELRSSQLRHEKQVEDLQRQLRLLQSGSSEGAQAELLERITTLEEERNVLKGELEAQTVHFEAKLLNEQREGALNASNLKEEQNRLEAHNVTISQLRERVKHLEELLAAKNDSIPNVVTQGEVDTLGTFLQLLRCPVRRTQEGQINYKAMIWHVVNSIEGVAALLCKGGEFNVCAATKKASMVWGSSALRSTTLASLFYDRESLVFLRSELESGMESQGTEKNIPEGFLVRDLGHIEMRNRLGAGFDASITCVKLPLQQGDRNVEKESFVVVIVSPVEGSNVPQEQPRQQVFDRQQATPQRMTLDRPDMMQYRKHSRCRPMSSTSSVHSDDITANDSASNVNAMH